MPSTYRSPSGPATPGKTRYVTLRHKDSAFPGKDGIRLADITHGTSNTIMVVEADEAHAVIWTKPDDLEFDPQEAWSRIDGAARGRDSTQHFATVPCSSFQDTIDFGRRCGTWSIGTTESRCSRP